MKEKLLWLGILLIAISWVLNYTYFQSKQLKEPIFFDHFYEVFIGENGEVTFYYLTNKKNPIEILGVTIDGLEGFYVVENDTGFMKWNDSSTSFVQEFRHHYLKSVTLRFYKEQLPMTEQDPHFSFENIDVRFDDQTRMKANIGKVNLYYNDISSNVIESRTSSSGSNHISGKGFVTKEPLTVKSISVPFQKQIQNDVRVKINLDQYKNLDIDNTRFDSPSWVEGNLGKEWGNIPGTSIKGELFPLKLRENEWLEMYIKFNSNRQSYFGFDIKFEGVTESGEPFVVGTPVGYYPYFSEKDIKKVIAERGVERDGQ